MFLVPNNALFPWQTALLKNPGTVKLLLSPAKPGGYLREINLFWVPQQNLWVVFGSGKSPIVWNSAIFATS